MKIGAIAGIHEDLVRLEQALRILDQAGCEISLCLGDIVGYSVPYFGFLESRDAHRAVQLVRRNCRYAVAGNHDLHAVRKTPSFSGIFAYPPDWYSLDMRTRARLAEGRVWLYEDELPAALAAEDEEYLFGLPEFLPLKIDGLGVMLSHYAYPDLVGHSTSHDPLVRDNLAQHLQFMREQGCSIGLSGHDGCDGMLVNTARQSWGAGFGVYDLPQQDPVWIQVPWVANGTYENGVLVLDTSRRQVESIPLRTPPHVVPDWAEG